MLKKHLDDEEINIRIAEFIRQKREDKNYSGLKLSSKSSVNHGTIYRLEKGINGSYKDCNITIKSLNKILKILDTNIYQLFKYVYKKR